jgi:carboxymethylenebutenolidase
MANSLQVQSLVGEWEHGAMTRREFFERAILLLGSAAAAEALLASCSPGVAPTATSAAAPTSVPAAATSVPAAAASATRAPASTGAATSAATNAPPSASSIPGFVDPSAVATSDVSYPSGAITMTSYLAKPKSGGPWPAVIVIHENRGLTDHIKNVTRRIANLGYAALGVDLLSRVGGTQKFNPPADPTQAINGLKQDDVNADMVASAAYLKAQSFVKPKIGIVGFCWGGGNSLMGAISSPDVVACAVFYGPIPTNLDGVQKLNGPTIGSYGALDTFVTPGVPALEAAMQKYNKPYEYKIYPGANHAFFNDTGPRFHEASAKDAWGRVVEFYKKNLG